MSTVEGDITHTNTHRHTHTLVIWSKWIQTNNPKSVIYRLASWPCSFLTLFKDIYFDITHKYNTKWFIRWHSSFWNHIDLIELTRWRQVLSILRQGSIGNVCYIANSYRLQQIKAFSKHCISMQYSLNISHTKFKSLLNGKLMQWWLSSTITCLYSNFHWTGILIIDHTAYELLPQECYFVFMFCVCLSGGGSL